MTGWKFRAPTIFECSEALTIGFALAIAVIAWRDTRNFIADMEKPCSVSWAESEPEAGVRLTVIKDTSTGRHLALWEDPPGTLRLVTRNQGGISSGYLGKMQIREIR